MQCPQCHQENPPQARFCLACGVRLTLACSACGTALPAGARFCLACGQPVRALDAVQARPTAPVAYTPKHLADKILTSRGALEGERKQVTVLFCDLANSTALAARLGPEAMHTLLNHFFELALAEVHRYEGTINQFLGDGFMALFGAPLAHEDHARRAVLAALGVQQKLRQEGVDAGLLTGGTEHAPPLPLSVRMGLNTGLVVVGSIGAVWDTPDVLEVHLAELKRLEFLYERTEATEPVYVFKHVLTQEVAYDSLLTSRRQALHAAAGRTLESLYAERLEEVYDRLAYHYARTAESAKAIEYLTRFAEKAARGYAHVEAVTALQEALVHAGARQAAASTTTVQDRVILALVLRLAHSLYFLGRFQDTLDFLLQQQARLERLQDAVLAGPYSSGSALPIVQVSR